MIIVKKLLITIDGPAGAGKTTVSRALADRLGYRYIDTGALYRAVALAVKTRASNPRMMLNSNGFALNLSWRLSKKKRVCVFF